ncbi:myb-like protein D [Biomphalaria glabrata]|uniref:Myb-like protein D n=1 Tax=Biomphalaria glabrata TaxID=6526 RepID=A0A9W3A537_BIOGL|nr:myb-like protein D [Biomphalaria glabrata]
MSTYDKILELAREMELKGEKKREFIERELDELKKKEREVAERDERAAERAHQKEMKQIEKEMKAQEDKIELARLDAAKHIASTYMSPKDMAKHLLSNLAGEPLNIIATLTPEQKTDYKAVKNRLLEHFGKSEDHYRKLFRDCKRMDSHPNHTIDRRDLQVAATINTDSSKFKYSNNNKTCFNCGRSGHIKSQCRSNNRRNFQYRSGTYQNNRYDHRRNSRATQSYSPNARRNSRATQSYSPNNRRNSRATQSYSPNDRRKQYNTINNYNLQNYQRRQPFNTNNDNNNFQNNYRQSRRDGYVEILK